MTDLKTIIDNITGLPTLPDVVAKVNQLVNDRNTSAADINDVISRDLSLSARILKMVNSPFYGFSRRITTITYAVVILGFNTVRNLALSAFVFEAFKQPGIKHFDLKEFWRYSISTAVAARLIADKVNPKLQEDAFMGGLLHGVGKAMMNEYLAEDIVKVAAYAKENKTSFYDAEVVCLDYSHCEVGALLLEKWNLPESITHVVRHYHAPGEHAENEPLLAIVHTASIVTRALLLGNAGDHRIPPLDEKAWAALNLDWAVLDGIMGAINVEAEKARTFLEAQ